MAAINTRERCFIELQSCLIDENSYKLCRLRSFLIIIFLIPSCCMVSHGHILLLYLFTSSRAFFPGFVWGIVKIPTIKSLSLREQSPPRTTSSMRLDLGTSPSYLQHQFKLIVLQSCPITSLSKLQTSELHFLIIMSARLRKHLQRNKSV